MALDEKKLGRDVSSVISRLFADGEEFPGHDGRQYAIIGINAEETESESFIDVVVKLDDGPRVVAKYAIILQQISHYPSGSSGRTKLGATTIEMTVARNSIRYLPGKNGNAGTREHAGDITTANLKSLGFSEFSGGTDTITAKLEASSRSGFRSRTVLKQNRRKP